MQLIRDLRQIYDNYDIKTESCPPASAIRST